MWGVNLTLPLSYFKKNLFNINITLYNWALMRMCFFFSKVIGRPTTSLNMSSLLLKILPKFSVNYFDIFNFKGCVRYIFASLFLGQNKSTCQIKRKMFFISLQNLFSFLRKSNFRILHFEISWHHQIPKHKTRNTFH